MSEPKLGYVYILRDYGLINTYKLGITTRNIQIRIKELNQSPSAAVKLEYLSPATSRYKLVEKKLHIFFKNQNTKTGENRSLREWFVLTDTEYELLKALLKYEFECYKK